MRSTWAGWALCLLGALVAVAGIAVMAVLGPDNRITTGPHPIETDDIAVVTAPKAIRWADVQVDVLAEVPVRKPIFVGVGNAVDVQDFVGGTQRLEITRFSRPWKIATREMDGQPNLPGAPTALDWWIDSAAGLGGASISTRLPDETVSIAILSVGSSNLSGLQVTVAYGVAGGFWKAAAVLLVGLAMVWSGFWLLRGPAWPDDGEDPDGPDPDDEGPDGVEEEIVYVYVDEDGVEREISPEEAAELEEVEVEVVETVERTPAPDPEPAGPEEVVYVYVDDDGVEHEVSADELADFEVIDEQERP
ncbi:hypothetical protein [Aeromicrobium wangtongii]|uniref:hypothetical protein n=1 Tax=Aeromicrobium wangtongii TaxID=2969247 RepID=UPI00201778A9|nr:hypothetical protein [Aeromicrobium wangtongii]MCL3820142.1 hypothetical protein [Aeromicrobium wangtongii]